MGFIYKIDCIPIYSFQPKPREVVTRFCCHERYVKPVANEPHHEKTCSDYVFVIHIGNRVLRIGNQSFKSLTIFYGCVARFVKVLVGNPEDRFPLPLYVSATPSGKIEVPYAISVLRVVF